MICGTRILVRITPYRPVLGFVGGGQIGYSQIVHAVVTITSTLDKRICSYSRNGEGHA